MADSIDNLIYAEAQRGLARQPGLFNKLSVRTGILLGVTTATTAFLGAIVVDKSGLHDWGTLALAAFVVAVGCCAAVLSPHRRWMFVEGAGALFVPYCRLSWCSRRCLGGSRSRSSVASTTSLRRGWALA